MPKRSVAIIAIATAALALTLHILAITGSAPMGMLVMFPMFFIGILSFLALIVTLNKGSRVKGNPFAVFGTLFRPIPPWGRVLFAAVFVYTGINFALFFAATGGGTIEQRSDGAFILTDHGRLIRVLNERGIRDVQTWQLRLFSGHILPFLVLPGLYFWFAPRVDRRPTDHGSPAP